MGLYVIFRKRFYIVYKPVFYLLLFIILHEIALSFFLKELPSYFINFNIVTMVNIVMVGALVGSLDANKLYNSFILVGVISMIGLLYHFIQINFFRQIIHPIQLPFMPQMGIESRFYNMGYRPLSFFTEPGAFSSYMTIPLFWSLYKRKIIFASIITISIFLSTSTNGFAFSAVIWGVMIFSGGYKKKIRVVLVLLVFCGIYLIFANSYFDAGINKISNTNYFRNVRIVNGPIVCYEMPRENLIFGINEANLGDYLRTNTELTVNLLGSLKDIYVTSIWMVLAKFGILGVILYLIVYLKLFAASQKIRPYIWMVLLAMFTQNVYLTGFWVVQIVFVIVFYINQKDIGTTQKDLRMFIKLNF